MCHIMGEMMPVTNRSAQNRGYGLRALIEELVAQGVEHRNLLHKAGLRSVDRSLTQSQRLAVLRAAADLATDPLTALKAGARQRVHYFGVYGFALATSPTFGDAFTFGRQHLDLAGAVLRISYRREGDTGILESHNPQSLGNLLPFVAEYWRSSMVALLGEILDESFPSRRMLFPYPKPDYAHAYPAFFDCPLEFGCDAMEWHFDAAVLAKPCPNASSLTANICQDFCESVTARSDDDSLLQRELRGFILGNTGRRCTADEAAAALGLSKRTLFRRLSQEGTSFQILQDQTRDAVAREYLENTRLPVRDIAERCGFGDEANFRKAFLRWRGQTPSKWRQEKHLITLAGSQKN
jgi:AraC-like DNA-binding protein